MNNGISKDFTLFSLIRFTLPTIVMLVFMSAYTIVDGIFVSRFVGTTALSAINIVFPLSSFLMGIGIMLGTGGSAIIGRQLGEGTEEHARETFSLIVFFTLFVGVALSLVCFICITPFSRILGADDTLLPYCVDYGKILMLFYSASVLQVLFQTLFVTAGKPTLGLGLNLLSGVANIVFDYVFIVLCDMGITGAAWGTVVGYLIGGVLPLLYFARPRTVLYFMKPKWDCSAILSAMLNGSSEMVSSLASAITTFLFNISMMHFAGEDGVAAITIILYAQFVFSATYLGFSNGVAPVISYNYGNRNIVRLKRLFRMCIGVIAVFSIAGLGFSYLMAVPAVAVFAPVGSNTYAIALDGYRIFMWNFLFAGINIFASSFFTALSNGKVSAAISFLRTFIFVVGSILILPHFLEINGIWLSIPVAEGCTMLIALFFLCAYRKVYHYL